MADALDVSNSEKILKDLINNVSTLQLSALARAAKLSPSIKTGRTIGPLDENQAPTSIKSSHDEESVANKKIDKLITKTKNHKIAIESSPVSLPPKNDLLDINVINTSVAAKLTEKNRRENVKKELEQRLNILAIENKKRQEKLAKSLMSQSNWLHNKVENDKQIFQIADEFVEDEIKQINEKTEKILHDKQKRLKAIAEQAIVLRRKKFATHYEKVCQLLKSERASVECEEYNKSLRELAIDFESLIQRIKNNNMGQSEILASESLCERIQSLDRKLCDDINKTKCKAAEEIKHINQPVQTKESLPQIAQQEQKQPQQTLQVQNTNNATDSTDSGQAANIYVSYETFEFYSNTLTFFNDKLQSLAPLENDPNMKKFLAACRRNINIPVAAICAVSPQHMQDKFDKIMNFIMGNTKKQSVSDVHISEHPLAKDYCIRYLAKKFIAVAGTEISANAQAAFPFASIIIAIWNRIPEFGKLLLGQIYTESIFLVPLLFPKSNFQNDIEHKIAFGYYINENALEDFSSYNKRQAGIVRLYAAIMISFGRHDDQIHPFPIENGWKWLSNLINIKPEMHDICATVIVEFLQIAAHEMLTLYGKQFKKLLSIMQTQYLPRLNQIDDGKAASKGKLEQVLDLILKYNRIDKPQGTVAKNFW